MSVNDFLQNEKNTKALTTINKVALDYVKENNPIKKDILYKKLWEKCLGFVFRLDINQQDDMFRAEIKSSLKDNEERLANSNHDLRKAFNKDVFIETITYTIKTYSKNPSNDFTRLFLSTYAIRNKASIGIESFKNKMRGFSFSENDRKLWHTFNKLIDDYSTKDIRFANKQLHMLTREDIHNILEAAGVGFKNETRYVEIAQQFANTQHVAELDSPIYEDADTTLGDKISDNSNMEKAVVNHIYIIKLFDKVIEMASSIQKKYFICFITLDILNHYSKSITAEMATFLDIEFMQFIKGYTQRKSRIFNELPDVVIADYLQVNKSAITKQRSNYMAVLCKARDMMRNSC